MAQSSDQPITRSPDHPIPHVLLVESGPRHLIEGLAPFLCSTWSSGTVLDLVTCYPGPPAGLVPGTTWQVSDCRDRASRSRLLRELRARRYSTLVIICAGVPIMTKWKWAIALRLRTRVLVVNENGDCFWLDRAHWPAIRHFVLFRAGLSGSHAVRTLFRLAAFPFTMAYLLLYAAFIHLRRLTRQTV